MTGLIDDRLRDAYLYLISQVPTVSISRPGRKISIVMHGYDYAVPDGRGVFGGWGLLPGPWLEPGFRRKGYSDLARRRDLTTVLRGTLRWGDGYKADWANEMHPTGHGFELVTERFAT